MMIKYLITMVLVCFGFSGICQQTSNVNQQIISNFGYGTMIEMKDVNGRPLIHKQYDADIQGHPFLIEDWSDAELVLVNGNVYHHAKIKINIERNELNMLDSLQRTIVLNKGIIRELHINQSTENKLDNTLILRNGYPGIDKQDTSNFYQILVTGKMTFLKYTRKSISVFKNDVSGETSKAFTDYIDRYVYFKGEMKILKRNKQFFLNMMNDKQDLIEKFIEKENIAFKNDSSIVKLIEYYNTLN